MIEEGKMSAPHGVKPHQNDLLGRTMWYGWAGTGPKYCEGDDHISKLRARLDGWLLARRIK